MDNASTLVPARQQTARTGTPAEQVDVSRRHFAALRNLMATWSWRSRFRRDLAHKSKDEPHLIDDIGLTRQQVEAETVKPFWQA